MSHREADGKTRRTSKYEVPRTEHVWCVLGISTQCPAGLSCLLEGEHGSLGEGEELERCTLPAVEKASLLSALRREALRGLEKKTQLLWF